MNTNNFNEQNFVTGAERIGFDNEPINYEEMILTRICDAIDKHLEDNKASETYNSDKFTGMLSMANIVKNEINSYYKELELFLYD